MRIPTIYSLIPLFLFLAPQSRAEPPANLDGDWKLVDLEVGGVNYKDMNPEARATLSGGMTIKGEHAVCRVFDNASNATISLDPGKNPKEMTISILDGDEKGKCYQAIYEIKDGLLLVCFDASGKPRPTKLESKKGSGVVITTYSKKDVPQPPKK